MPCFEIYYTKTPISITHTKRSNIPCDMIHITRYCCLIYPYSISILNLPFYPIISPSFPTWFCQKMLYPHHYILGNPNIFPTNADQRIPIIILLLYIPPENNLSLPRYIPQYIPQYITILNHDIHNEIPMIWYHDIPYIYIYTYT